MRRLPEAGSAASVAVAAVATARWLSPVDARFSAALRAAEHLLGASRSTKQLVLRTTVEYLHAVQCSVGKDANAMSYPLMLPACSLLLPTARLEEEDWLSAL